MGLVKAKINGQDFRLTPANTEIFLFPYPYEELSCVTHQSRGEKILAWDWGLMEVCAKAGVTVNYHDADPPGACIDLYAKDQVTRIDEEWKIYGPGND